MTTKKEKSFLMNLSKRQDISPVIYLHFKKIKEIYSNFSDKINENSKGRFSPLDGYLLSEKITFSELWALVSEMGQRARISFLNELDWGNQLIGKDPSEELRNTFSRLIRSLRLRGLLDPLDLIFQRFALIRRTGQINTHHRYAFL